MTPFLYFAIRSLYRSNGKTLKKLMWCDDDAIKPYFIAAGKALDTAICAVSVRTAWKISRFRLCRRRCKATPFSHSAVSRST